MKKKLSLLLCTLVLALGVTSCGKVSDDDEIAGRTVKEYRAEITSYMEAYGDVLAGDSTELKTQLSAELAAYYQTTLDEYAKAQGMTTDQLVAMFADQYLANAGTIVFPEDSTVLSDFTEEFKSVVDEAGEYKGVGECKVEKSGKTVTSTLIGDFSKRDLKMTFVYSTLDTSVPTAMNIEPVYTLGETMQKAALNTVMGILIVFCMLVIMSGVIKCFEIIPKLQNKAKDKAEKAEAAPVATVAPQVTATKETDDLQLVAVIAAAIAASTGASTDSFVVRSIKKRH